jgi:acetyl/propionyl-CoA carboxylase alpha subunit
VTERNGGEFWIQLPTVLVTALVDPRRYRRGGAGPVAIEGELKVVAPMPGRIVRVLVKPGDSVEARQGLWSSSHEDETRLRLPRPARSKRWR